MFRFKRISLKFQNETQSLFLQGTEFTKTCLCFALRPFQQTVYYKDFLGFTINSESAGFQTAKALEVFVPDLKVWRSLTLKFRTCELDMSFSCEKSLTDFLICLTWSVNAVKPEISIIRRRQEIYWKILKSKLFSLAHKNNMNTSVGVLLADALLNYFDSLKTKGRNEMRFYKQNIQAILAAS